MFKNKFTICVDMDDTIENLLDAWLEYLNNKYDRNVKIEDITSWELSDAYPELTETDIFECLSKDEFWKTVTPKEDAIYYLNKLVIEDHQDIYIVTSCNGNFISAALKYKNIIEKYFSFIDWKHYIVLSNKQMLKCDVMIDDGPHNLEFGDYYKLLVDASHNKKYDCSNENMLRVYNWIDAYNALKNLDWFYSCNNIQTVKQKYGI